MEHRHFPLDACEAAFEAVDRLRSQGDFRNHHQHAASAFQDPLGGLQIDFRFPAAGHSMEQNGALFRRVFHRPQDLVEGSLLFAVEGEGFGGDEVLVSKRIALDRLLLHGNPFGLFQRLQ